MLFSTAFSMVALLAAEAAAHGAVTSYVIGSTTYPGYQGFSPASSPPTIQRQWPDYNPIMSVSDAKMLCNTGTSAALNATIEAGSTITAKWAQWTHQQGPVMVWMYKCAGTFKACDGKGKGWFKIDQTGMTAPPLTGTSWGTAIVYSKLAYTSTIPKALAPGNYLIRHELLALHQANTPQFYPECAQLTVTGSGTQTPSGSFLTSIPGYATSSDPGVMIDIYSSTATTYTPPGPAVWTGGASKRFEA
ncbi:family 61 putative glycoside hydrolase [Mollisia scopiformis]|uniref:AA9 family lytic polysaccharide monooxygenase n=1 Tax=Mollisia scopiformis TaxID=149040 RepID=A0A194XHW1_MOLSC|nr:family 61 putative glycoside hydrolase [Mollisia scopiformis]KUJ19714.1 family 61 putative glycoside hydrolase [Mollisia scopiformis]